MVLENLYKNHVSKYETKICSYIALVVNVVTIKPHHWRIFLVFPLVKDFLLTATQISHSNIVFHSVEHVVFCAWKLRFVDIIFFFVKNGCWVIPIASRSFWWTCSIVRYMWIMVSTFQKWLFRCCRQGIRETVRCSKND